MVNSNDIAEDIRRNLKIVESTMEGVAARMEEYNTDDDTVAGMQWAFWELKDRLREVTDQ